MINKNILKGLRKYKQTIKLNQVQKEVNALRAPLLALPLVCQRATPAFGINRALPAFGLLGDASIPLDGGNPRVVRRTFGQTIERAEYIWHLYNSPSGTLALAVGRLCRNTLRPERPSGSGDTRCAGNPNGARYYQSMRLPFGHPLVSIGQPPSASAFGRR